MLGARDKYVRATTALERSAKLRVADAVDEERFMRFMRDRALEWTHEQQRNLALPIEQLARFLEGIKWRMPGRILLIQSDAALEDDSPHTRGEAIVVPASFLARGPGLMAHLLAHEMFHVLTRANSELKERLYARYRVPALRYRRHPAGDRLAGDHEPGYGREPPYEFRFATRAAGGRSSLYTVSFCGY